ncbi:hypothetical protein RhiirA1_466998 [Rhizophagus irregularis]|uniref:Uncharacterized protein n=1 Tax=Rhizophagus irregularis TaxID=588596 RepID=A0A2N0RCU0_9GLOM|nr:hypothetical protein RhiirA1_466998 [Rhizophagus irregularis]
MSSELEVLITELEAKKTDEKATRLEALRQSFAELEARILKLEQDQAERENKKNHKFQVHPDSARRSAVSTSFIVPAGIKMLKT